MNEDDVGEVLAPIAGDLVTPYTHTKQKAYESGEPRILDTMSITEECPCSYLKGMMGVWRMESVDCCISSAHVCQFRGLSRFIPVLEF